MVLSFFLRLNLSPKGGEATCLLGLLDVPIDGCASELSASPRLPRLLPPPRLGPPLLTSQANSLNCSPRIL